MEFTAIFLSLTLKSVLSENDKTSILSCAPRDDQTISTCDVSSITPITFANQPIRIENQKKNYKDLSVTSLIINEPNVLNFLPTEAFKYFPNVEYFEMDGVGMKTLVSDAFANCDKLTTIVISNNNFQNIPKSFASKCGELKNITMTGNEIKTIDENALMKLSKLEVLDLSDNEIVCIPSKLFIHTPDILGIFFRSNKITAIGPETFMNLKNLIKIDLMSNEIEAIPTMNFKGTAVNEALDFDLSDNPIKSIQNGFFDEFFETRKDSESSVTLLMVENKESCLGNTNTVVQKDNLKELSEGFGRCYAKWTDLKEFECESPKSNDKKLHEMVKDEKLKENVDKIENNAGKPHEMIKDEKLKEHVDKAVKNDEKSIEDSPELIKSDKTKEILDKNAKNDEKSSEESHELMKHDKFKEDLEKITKADQKSIKDDDEQDKLKESLGKIEQKSNKDSHVLIKDDKPKENLEKIAKIEEKSTKNDDEHEKFKENLDKIPKTGQKSKNLQPSSAIDQPKIETTIIPAQSPEVITTDIICRFYVDHKSRYTCVIDNVDSIITKLSGTHVDQLTDNDVSRVYFTNSILRNIPMILFTTFKNLKFLSVSHCSLGIITKNTFKLCNDLIYFDASFNDLVYISPNAFEKCQKLEKIDITGNQIDILEQSNKIFIINNRMPEEAS